MVTTSGNPDTRYTGKNHLKPVMQRGWLVCPVCRKEFYGEMDYAAHDCKGYVE